MSCGCAAPYTGPSLATVCYGGTYILFMAIIDTLVRNKCAISEICERVVPKLEPDPEYDFVVIGGGAAGSVVAGRLSEIADWKVLLIEAGSDEPPGSQIPSVWTNFLRSPEVDWGYSTEPQEYACFESSLRRCRWVRIKMLGGCGSINGMMYMRGVPKDYDGWEAMGNPGWGNDDVFEYFIKAENNQQAGTLVRADIHGTKGPMSVSRFPDYPSAIDDILAAAEEVGYPVVKDLNEANFTGFALTQAASLNGVRVSSARAYLRPARNRENLHVMLNATVTRVLLDPTVDAKQISEVEFVFNDKMYRVKVKKEAILSAGAVNSPQILLLSGIGPKDELDKVDIVQVHNLPGVGQNLHNHVALFVDLNLNKVKSTNDLDWVAAYQYFSTQTGPMSSTGISQLTARLTTEHGDRDGDNPDLQFFFGGYAATCCRECEVGEPADPDDVDAPRILTILAVCIKPKSRGYIGLHTSNPLHAPLMNPNYLKEEDDVKVLIGGVRIIQKLANTTVLKEKYGIELKRKEYGNCSDIYGYDTDPYWECAIRYHTGPENHQAGTCKMGPSSDPLAVVDSDLKVHGVNKLRVMDASIMPVVVSGNPHATVVMIAEKGVDAIKKEWLGDEYTSL